MGLFIVFEGIEGSGKSTQSRMLRQQIPDLDVPVLLTEEPGGTALGCRVRVLLKQISGIEIDPLSELLLFAASRVQLVTMVIRPVLAQNGIVICDRYASSTLAYQGYGRGLDSDIIKEVNDIATAGLRPDLIILLDLPVEEGLRRKGSARERDRFEREGFLFHHRVRQGYLEMATADSGRWLVIDAAQSKTRIRDLVWERVQQVLE